MAHLRGEAGVSGRLLQAVARGDRLATSCVNVAELIRGLRPRERDAADLLLTRLRYLETTREAAERAGRYQATLAARGTTIHTPDALVAGTARAHGAVLVTDNAADFPMRDIRVVSLEEAVPALG